MHANYYTNDVIPHYSLWFDSIWALGMHANHYTNDVIPHDSLWFDSIWALGMHANIVRNHIIGVMIGMHAESPD
jgi:hypothetical protein